MNVQYYPCKTCGSKFPSYYFVHKHRKLCHAEEDDEANGQGSNRTINNRIDHAISTNSKLITSVPIGKSDNINEATEVQSNNQKDEDCS
ncbi:AGAP004733-PA-like protein [Anopheles sinensis]|uniref:AGAP004733-PA-like protein n=1 Tax=Anopheles sinensis TaxID=74873 RepID=A0A084VZU4_ANOSI|nr:AGAP004733-PA-like protein [Anopheles sinensis]